jgi:site-specific recombinase XerD
MVKSTIQINENMDISQYKKVIAFLKRQNDTYQPKKSKVLTMDHVTKFLIEAADDTFLLMKVVLIFGLNCACRRVELCSLTVDYIEDTGNILVVTLYDTKTKKKCVFTVGSECNGYEIYHKYLRLRPKTVKHNRFFLFYHHGKCKVQPVGIHSFAKMPQKIAEYLKLPDAASYTEYCLRRTSATLLADSGVDIQVLKRRGGWSSNSVAEGYVEERIANKMRTSKGIFSEGPSKAPLGHSEVMLNKNN